MSTICMIAINVEVDRTSMYYLFVTNAIFIVVMFTVILNLMAFFLKEIGSVSIVEKEWGKGKWELIEEGGLRSG